MKAVLIAIAGLLVINVRAQESCPTPTYKEEIVPKCLSNKYIQMPCYSDPTAYYLCENSTVVKKFCSPPREYFSYVLQTCTNCANYIPAAECSQNKLGLACQPIADETNTTAAPTTVTTVAPTTAAPTTVTTGAPTTVTTGAPTTLTTPAPTPPVGSTPSPGASTTVSDGTTVSVPQPPSPNDPNVPAPPTPSPTVGTIATGPPVIQ